MPITLPLFGNTSCRALTVCGRIKEPKHPMVSVLPAREPLVAAYRGADEKVYLRVLPGGKKHTHLHVDCALQGFFPKDHAPKTNTTKDKLLAVLEKAVGLTLDAEICGEFLVPLADLPEQGLIRSLSAEQKTADLSARLTSGECKIEGAPVRRMFWSIRDEQKDVFIRIEANREEKVDDQYLVRSLEWIEKQFTLFVLGKTADANG